MQAYFNRFCLEMTRKQAESVSHQGECIEDVRELLKNPKIMRQLNKIDIEDIRRELLETGGWDNEELQGNMGCLEKILWIAGGNIKDDLRA